MPPKKKSSGPPKIKVKVEYLHEDWEVEIICPGWARHKLDGGEPSAAYEDEGGDSMWELYVLDHGVKAAKRELEKRAAAEKAAEQAANDKRIKSLKDSFAVFDTDGSGTLEAEELGQILTRMCGPDCPGMTEADAKAFIKEFDRDGDGMLDVNEVIIAMGVVSDAHDEDGDGEADLKQHGDGKYDGKEDDFAAKLAAGEGLVVAGMKKGNVVGAVNDARRLQGV